MALSRTILLLLGPAIFVAGAGTGIALDRAGARPPIRSDGELRSSEQAVDRGELAPTEQAALIRAVAEAYFERKDLRNAIAWGQRYVKAGGPDAEVRAMLVQAYLRSSDYANAARELQWEITTAERAGRAPGEDRLRLLQDCYARLNDANAYAWSLEKLIAYHPRRDYWADLLDRLEKRPDMSEGLLLDIARLRLAADALVAPADYLKVAAQLQEAGYPAEARAAIEVGIARRVLGTGADAQRHRQLLAQYVAEAQAQQRKLADPQLEEVAANARTGLDTFNLGYALATLGNHSRGVALMEQGLRRGGLSGPQIARLRLAEAYLMAGMRAKALELFRTIGGRHGGADLGRIWALYVQNLR